MDTCFTQRVIPTHHSSQSKHRRRKATAPPVLCSAHQQPWACTTRGSPAPSSQPPSRAAESQVLRRELHGPTNVWKSAQESSDKGHAWSTQRVETCVKVQGQGSASPARQVKQLLNSDLHQMLTDYLKHCRNEQKGHQDLSYTLNNP